MGVESGERYVRVKMHVMTTSKHCEVEVGEVYRSICPRSRRIEKARSGPLHVLSAPPWSKSACHARICASAASSLRLQSVFETLQRPNLCLKHNVISLEVLSILLLLSISIHLSIMS